MGTYVNVWIILFFGLVALGIYWHRQDKETVRQLNDWLKENNLYLYSTIFKTQDGFGIDYDSGRIGFIFRGNKKIINISDIIAVELVENGGTITKTKRGSQAVGVAVGALAFGPVGALVGGLSGSKKTKETVSKLSINVITKNRGTPLIEIRVFESSLPTEKRLVDYQSMMPWYARLRALIEE